MPKIWDVKDKHTGKTLQMQAIDAKEAVDNDPKRYAVKGYSAAAEEPFDEEPTRAKPPQRLTRTMTAKQRAAAANLSASSGEPDKPENPDALKRLEAQAAGENPQAVKTKPAKKKAPKRKAATKPAVRGKKPKKGSAPPAPAEG